MTTKMKGLLKGLRYISQIFDDDVGEREPEMKIGYPTDVKHVAHIGWDGGSSVKDSPSWMNDFKQPSPSPSPPRQSSSAPSSAEDDKKDGSSLEGVCEASESSRATSGTQSYRSSPAPEFPEIPKSSRRHNHSSSSGDARSPTKAKPEKHRPPRRSSKGSHHEQEVLETSEPNQLSVDSAAADTVPSQLHDQHKKSRRKKPKDSGASTRSSSRSSKPQVEDSGSSRTHENESLSTRRYGREGSQGTNAVDEADGNGHGLAS